MKLKKINKDHSILEEHGLILYRISRQNNPLFPDWAAFYIYPNGRIEILTLHQTFNKCIEFCHNHDKLALEV